MIGLGCRGGKGSSKAWEMKCVLSKHRRSGDLESAACNHITPSVDEQVALRECMTFIQMLLSSLPGAVLGNAHANSPICTTHGRVIFGSDTMYF